MYHRVMKAHPEIKTEYLIRLYESGKSLPEISEMVKITDQAIWLRLKNAGVKLRSISDAIKLSFKTGRSIILSGKNHPCWKGGRYKHKDGYIHINSGRDREHRVVWEKANGKIPLGWVIHHLNGIRDDNRLENLCALPIKRHSPATIVEPYQQRIIKLEKIIKKREKELSKY